MDSPGRRKRRRRRQVFGVGSPQQERRGHYSPQAAAPSEPSCRRPLRSYTAWPRLRPPPPPLPLSLPSPGSEGRGGAEPVPKGSINLAVV